MPVIPSENRRSNLHHISTVLAASNRHAATVVTKSSKPNEATVTQAISQGEGLKTTGNEEEEVSQDTSMLTVNGRKWMDIDSNTTTKKTRGAPNSVSASSSDAKLDTLIRIVTNINNEVDSLSIRLREVESKLTNQHHSGSTLFTNGVPLERNTPILENRFYWVRDKLFLEVARNGLLQPINLIRLVNPTHEGQEDTGGTITSSGQHARRISTRGSDNHAFVDFFSHPDIFAAAWWSWGECMVDGCSNSGSASVIMTAISSHLRLLLNCNRTHQWSACMSYHNFIHTKRLSQGRGFDPRLWYESVDNDVSHHSDFFNSETALATTTTPSSTAITPPKSSDNPNLERLIINHRKIAKAANFCYSYNEGNCKNPCVGGRLHQCWVCTGPHRGRKCPDA